MQEPSEEEFTNFAPGEFEYVDCENIKKMLQTAYNAINLTETWGFVKQDCDSFMLSNSKQIDIIYKKIEELGYTDHSGFSFGFTMRNMQFIAKHGEQKFKVIYKK